MEEKESTMVKLVIKAVVPRFTRYYQSRFCLAKSFFFSKLGNDKKSFHQMRRGHILLPVAGSLTVKSVNNILSY